MSKFRRFRQAAVSLFLALCLMAGAGSPFLQMETYAASAVHMNQTSLTLTVGDTYRLIVLKDSDFSSYKGTVRWSSSKSSVAKVSSSGTVTAVGGGNAVITATAGSSKMTCKVTVKKAASNAAKKIRLLGNALISQGTKGTNYYYVNYKVNYGTVGIYYEKGKRIIYATYYEKNDIKMYVFMYHNPSTPQKVILKGVFYYKGTLFGKTIATLQTSRVNSNTKKTLGFHVQAGTLKNASIKKSIVNLSETLTDFAVPYWNSAVKTLTGMTMKDMGFSSI